MPRYAVDLRSDTVSTPSPAMRRAMADAEVGDAWYGDDPTVNRLQDRAAELTGHEAALFVPTGTMANQIALRLHVSGGGHLVACSDASHVATTEMMTAATLSGIAFRTAATGDRGWLTADQARALLEPDAYYDVEVVDLLSLEDTVGGTGGRVVPQDELADAVAAGREAGVAVHLDGARVFNAAVASGVEVRALTAEVDTVMFCVSKGLGAPIGSLLCGPAEPLREARRLWILYGGAWRQAGIVAAAGLIALEEGPSRLHEDHARARRLAEAIGEISPGAVDLEQVATNMVFVDTEAVGLPLLETLDRLAALGVGATHSAGKVRLVTHVDIDDADVASAIDAWRSVAGAAEEG